MRVFVAGSTGAIGRILVPLLIEIGHDVVALTRDERKAAALEKLGAKVAIADALNKKDLSEAIIKAAPEVIIHELTALAGVGDLKKFDKEFELTNRFRTEVTDTMIEAARSAGTRRFIAQSFCGWPFAREGGPVKSEEDPLDPDPPGNFRKSMEAIRYLENAVKQAADLQAFALRYGMFYGPGTAISSNGPIVDLIRKRKMPIVGNGAGIWSFIHVRDAARATAAAVSNGEPGIYNIVDDDPAPVSVWLPYFAQILGAKPPRKLPEWIGRMAIGDGGVVMMTSSRGGSNAKAKRELDWEPMYKSWRQGFAEGLD